MVIMNKLKITKEEIYLNELNNQNDWKILSRYYNLSENIIDEFADKVQWGLICINQDLSELFIEKHIDKIDWDYVS